jgi:hypothetical protein
MLKQIFGKKENKITQNILPEGSIPHIQKQNIIVEYKNRFGLSILVETGTYLGEMIEAQKNNFVKTYSIELSEKLFKRAKKKFLSEKNIVLLQGDSGKRLAEVVAVLREPALFWLDGHYSGGMTALGDKECPVREELAAIFKSEHKHIILIDDARMFNGTHDYPTIEEIKKIIENFDKKYSIEVKNDIIRLTP